MAAKKPRTHTPEVNQALQATFSENQKKKGYERYGGWASPENKKRIKIYEIMLDKKYPPKPLKV